MSVHPPDKQTPSRRLATAALDVVYGLPGYEAAHSPPLFAGQALLSPGDPADGTARVRVSLSRPATTKVPPWATASSTLGQPGSIPRNACLPALMPPFHNPEDCGWPRLYIVNGTAHKQVVNATATLVNGGHAIELTAQLPAGYEVVASS